MAGLIRSLFKGKKSNRKENKESGADEKDYIAFESCPSATSSSFKELRPRTARFADDNMLSATAAYHTAGVPRLRKGPQSCPGGAKGEEIVRTRSLSRKASDRRQNFEIDRESDFKRGRSQREPKPQYASMRHGRSHYSLYDAPRSDTEDQENEDEIEMFERKSEFYMRKFEESERRRKEERQRQERLEHERNSIQDAISKLTYCTTVQQLASAQQMEQLKRERDQFKKELGRYKSKFEKLENKFERLETKTTTTSTMSPSYGDAGFMAPFQPMQPSPMYQQAPPFSFNYPMPSTNRRHLNPPTTLTNPHHHGSLDFVNYQKPHHGDFQNLLMTTSSTAATTRVPGNLQNRMTSSTTSSSGCQHSGSTSFAVSHTSDGAGEALVNPLDLSFLRSSSAGGEGNSLSNMEDDDEDEVKNYRHDDAFSLRSAPFSEITQSSAMTSKTNNTR